MSGSGFGRKKEMRGPWTAERMREGGWDGGTVPPWRNGFLGSDIVVADWAERAGENVERRGLNEARK